MDVHNVAWPMYLSSILVLTYYVQKYFVLTHIYMHICTYVHVCESLRKEKPFHDFRNTTGQATYAVSAYLHNPTDCVVQQKKDLAFLMSYGTIFANICQIV
jgi:hypothetical protein